MKQVNLSIFVAILLISLCGCPGSRLYQPLPKWEAKFYAEARKDVFPHDVQQYPEKYKDTLVVWTGIIKKIEHTDINSWPFVKFITEHHYFDWIEDDGLQREKYFLSPKGEGYFTAIWPDDKEYVRFFEQFSEGDFLIAYGYPKIINNEIILEPTQNLRPIKPQWFRTDMLVYGRPGEEMNFKINSFNVIKKS